MVEGGFEGGGGDVGARGEGGQNIGDNVLVFFGLEGAGGVKEAASGGEAGEGCGEDFALAGGLTGKIRGEKTLLYLWVTTESSSATAGDVAEDQVEESFGFGEIGGVGFKGANLGGVGVEAGGQGLEAAGVGVGGEDLGGGVAAGEDEGLAAGRGAAVPDTSGAGVAGGG